MTYNEIEIPSNGILHPDDLYYYSLINQDWMRVKTIDDTGCSILLEIEHPESGSASIIVPRFYSSDMQFQSKCKL